MKYIVCSAWPYVNNVPHLGTMIGSLLSGDVYNRYLKLKG
ncbi:MAG: class I tRNA ligase family protein, partial [Fervidicoccaceae archaeon]